MIDAMDNRLRQIEDHVVYIRDRLDQQIKEAGDNRVTVEQRLATIEVKSGLWGAVGGILTGLGAALGLHMKGH